MFQRGVGHVEAILSFVLFASFIFVGLYFFTPTGNTNIADSTLKYSLNKISANTSVEIQSYSIKIYPENVPSANQGVVAVEFPSEIVTISDEKRVRVEKHDGTVLPASRLANIIYLKPSREEFVIIKFSEDFVHGPSVNERPAVNQNQYKIASSSSRKVISEKRALELNISYYNSYEALKDNFGIPPQSSFGFNMQMPNYTISVPTIIPEGIEVFSTVTRREVLTLNGDSAYMELSVKIW